ncbi:hypothetical protein C8R44DRAFT_757919 [Mycena epipterygia]|nr:hypothetical protein C8R44DRAFT_757919 [Mycena epipterygia]
MGFCVGDVDMWARRAFGPRGSADVYSAAQWGAARSGACCAPGCLQRRVRERPQRSRVRYVRGCCSMCATGVRWRWYGTQEATALETGDGAWRACETQCGECASVECNESENGRARVVECGDDARNVVAGVVCCGVRLDKTETGVWRRHAAVASAVAASTSTRALGWIGERDAIARAVPWWKWLQQSQSGPSSSGGVDWAGTRLQRVFRLRTRRPSRESHTHRSWWMC